MELLVSLHTNITQKIKRTLNTGSGQLLKNPKYESSEKIFSLSTATRSETTRARGDSWDSSVVAR